MQPGRPLAGPVPRSYARRAYSRPTAAITKKVDLSLKVLFWFFRKRSIFSVRKSEHATDVEPDNPTTKHPTSTSSFASTDGLSKSVQPPQSTLLKIMSTAGAQTKRCTFMALALELRCGGHLARARRGASFSRSRALGRAFEERGRPLAEGMQPKCRHVAKEHSSCLSSATIWIFGRWRRLGMNPAGGVRAQFNLWRGRASRAAMPSGPSAATTQTG